MRTLFKSCAAGALVCVALPAFAQPAKVETNIKSNVPSEQGSQLNAETGSSARAGGGYYPDDESPWFGAENLRNELKLDDDQMERLNRAYGDTWRQMRANNQNNNGGEQDAQARSQRLNEYRDRFDNEFTKSSRDIFRNPEQQARFNQLNLQYQGYGAFQNPRLQRQLNLNQTQNRQLQELYNDWNSEIEGLREGYASNREDATNRFNELRNRSNERFQGILNEQQRQSYNEMTGQPFDFGADTYLNNQASAVNREASPGFNTGQSPGFNTGLNPTGDTTGTGAGTPAGAGTRTGGTGTGGTGTSGTGGTGSGSGTGGSGSGS